MSWVTNFGRRILTQVVECGSKTHESTDQELEGQAFTNLSHSEVSVIDRFTVRAYNERLSVRQRTEDVRKLIH